MIPSFKIPFKRFISLIETPYILDIEKSVSPFLTWWVTSCWVFTLLESGRVWDVIEESDTANCSKLSSFLLFNCGS
ncbi:MAG: hypothetical protein ACKPAD_02280, partial [Bacteroidota bacterium]